MTTIRRAGEGDAAGCVAVLEGLPDFFTPDTHDEVRAGIAEHDAWVACEGEGIVGFVLVEARFPAAAEITFAAVRAGRRGDGIGTRLLDRALDELRQAGTALVEVKTLDASAGYEPYVATRAFWERHGFRQIDRIDRLPGWQAGNPAAVYIASLAATRG
ncbi:MAG: GNAT family N-acetyltransferase [Acidimicrobiia bacterium]|nr:GNAT family N-acetyltransferase [Acidimicrobiia bacterium]